MTQLKDFGWWPNVWIAERGGSPATADEIRKDGVLKNARPLPGGLTLAVDHDGVIYTSNVSSNLSEDFLILLRHLLMQHLGEPVEMVEDIEIDTRLLTYQ